MALFRRGDTAVPPAPEVVPDRPVAQQGKGRPTPSRKDAEAARKQTLKVPTDPKAAKKAARQRASAERARSREAMLSGDERYLPARDAGPVKSAVRDLVDSRRSAGEFFVPVAVLVLVLGMIPSLAQLLIYVWVIMMVGIVVDSALLILKIRRELPARVPGESTKGAIPYALLRSVQLRRLRLPKPKVKVGGAPVTPKAARSS